MTFEEDYIIDLLEHLAKIHNINVEDIRTKRLKLNQLKFNKKWKND